MWRRHAVPNNPSPCAICATCMQFLPLVKIYCKWDLEEDCTNLRALVLCFDSEAELDTHELGRSLLLVLPDDDIVLQVLPPRQLAAAVNPFDAIGSRLAAIDNAFHSLQPHVDPVVDFWEGF